MRKNRTIYMIVSSLFLLMGLLVTNTTAQETAPFRESDREAPERKPIVLETTPLAGNQAQTIIQLPAVADTYLASERPFQNFGSSSLFLGYNLAGADNYGAERIVVRFDIDSTIPDNAVINSATLRLRLSFSSPTNDDPMGTVLRRVASHWQESTVTWNSEPTWTAIDDVTYVGHALDWYEWQLTDVVNDWYLGTYANYGVEIIGDEAVQQRERAFYSRETTTSFFPQLVVNYTAVNDSEPPSVTVMPLPTYADRSFPVSWEGTDTGGAGIAYYDVQFRVDGGVWQSWLTGSEATSAEFGEGENGRLYEFRARGVDKAGNEEPFAGAEASTIVDSKPPQTDVMPLPVVTNSNTFTVSWQSEDGSVSGIQGYDVQYQIDEGPWQLWLSQTTATSAQFIASDNDAYYRFEARAIDNAQQIEPFLNQAEAATIVDVIPPLMAVQRYLPIVFDQ